MVPNHILETLADTHLLDEAPDAHDVQPSAPPLALTPRETEVLRLIAEGASNKVIARSLGISVHTAKFHVGAVVAKLGARGRADAVARALRAGVLML